MPFMLIKFVIKFTTAAGLIKPLHNYTVGLQLSLLGKVLGLMLILNTFLKPQGSKKSGPKINFYDCGSTAV